MMPADLSAPSFSDRGHASQGGPAGAVERLFSERGHLWAVMVVMREGYEGETISTVALDFPCSRDSLLRLRVGGSGHHRGSCRRQRRLWTEPSPPPSGRQFRSLFRTHQRRLLTTDKHRLPRAFVSGREKESYLKR